MCGIAGIVDYSGVFGPDRLGAIVTAMRDTMVHRGPDDAGVWIDPEGRCALAHRRLSIIDLRPDGRQPMEAAGTGVHVTFNGEIYNYQELKAELETTGATFRTRTDTEVIPNLLKDIDPGRLDRLDGMYAFGVWHSRNRQPLLARDPFGKKPLYYVDGPGWFAFASELSALARIPGFDGEIDRDALSLYLLLQYVPSPWSIYRSVRKLEPGGYLMLEFPGGGARPVFHQGRHFQFRTGRSPTTAGMPFEARVDLLAKKVTRAVEKRLVADVPLGAFLSGGVDSSLVAAIATKELGLRLSTFSVGFADTDETEHGFAREVADILGTDHHEHLVHPDAVEMVGEIAGRLDEPNGDTSCLPTFFLCEYARRSVTVALSGDGGDELFGGYHRYIDSMREVGSLGARMMRSLRERRKVSAADAYLSPRLLTNQPEVVAALMGGLTPDISAALDNWRGDLDGGRRPFLHSMRNLDVDTYLPGAVLAKVDRMSMQVSLEVRCPLLDREVGALASGLAVDECIGPGGETKRLLKALASRYLPGEIVHRRKMGFGLPANSWSRERVTVLMNDLFAEGQSHLSGLLDRKGLDAWLRQQSEGHNFSIYKVWPLLILELWLRNRGAAVHGLES